MTWRWQVVRGGEFWLDAGSMMGIIPKAVWSRWMKPDEQNRMPLQQNSLLLEGHGRLVVVEVGIGDKFGEKERAIYKQEDRAIHDALQEIDCDPNDVTDVILTHLHFDHAGGLTRRDPTGGDRPALTFPNARIIVQEREWEDAIANRSTMHKTYLKNHLTPEVAERVMLLQGESSAIEHLPGITAWPVPGHTWGQQAVRFVDEAGRTVVFVPDVMPTVNHALPTACMSYDVESYTSQQERLKLQLQASDHDWTLVLVHEHGHPIHRCRPNPERPGMHQLEPIEV